MSRDGIFNLVPLTSHRYLNNHHSKRESELGVFGSIYTVLVIYHYFIRELEIHQATTINSLKYSETPNLGNTESRKHRISGTPNLGNTESRKHRIPETQNLGNAEPRKHRISKTPNLGNTEPRKHWIQIAKAKCNLIFKPSKQQNEKSGKSEKYALKSKILCHMC